MEENKNLIVWSWLDFKKENGSSISFKGDNLKKFFIEDENVMDNLLSINNSFGNKKSRREEVIPLLENNKILFNYFEFINIYYWCTDFSIDLISESINGKINNIIKNNFLITYLCPSCRDIINIYPNSRKHKNEIIKHLNEHLCKKCEEELENYRYEFNLKEEKDFINACHGYSDSKKINKDDVNNKYIIEELRNMLYKEYLQTEHWKVTRLKALKKANYKCEVCNSKEDLNVHHKTYINRGNEKPEDLIVLCHDCHAKFHDKLEKDL